MTVQPSVHTNATGHAGRWPGRGAATGGVAAIAAGVCWVVKGGTILATGIQPPLLFELAPLLMAVAVLGLVQELPSSRRRTMCLVAAGAALVFAVPVLVGELIRLPAVVTGAGMAAANLLILLGLAVAGMYLRRHRRAVLPLALGVATVPALLVGGLLTVVLGERALEAPLVLLGVAWGAVGLALVRRQYQSA